ncbi:hypothetical protein Ndes2526A_g00264 [Nannochloris sp. 'desiccata']
MESARIDNKRKASAVSEEETADFLLDDLKLEASFLHDDFIDIPHLGPDSLLTLDSASDAFPGLDLFNDGTAVPNGGAAAAGPLSLADMFGSDDELADFLPGGGAALNKVSPSTSESGNINEGRGGRGLPIATTGTIATAPTTGAESSGGAAASNPSNNVQEDEAKKLARMQRNRENAYLSRQRKKQQMAELQQTCTQLRGQATQLTCLVHRLVAENCLLRHHLGSACQKAGMPVPDVPSAMKPTMAGAAQAAVGIGTGMVGAPAMAPVKQQPVILRPGMVPITAQQQQQQPAAPAAVPAVVIPQQAAAPAAADALPTTTASGRPVRTKRARVTGAGAAFLTLFSIFLFVGPMAPLTGRNNTSSGSPSATAGYLPPAEGLLSSDHATNQLLGPITRSRASGGRSLLQSASIEDSSTAASDPLPLSASLVHQTLDALLQDPYSQRLPAQALQRLQDLAPAAVVLDPNDSRLNDAGTGNSVPQSSGTTSTTNPLAAHTAFPILANSFFKAAGLDAPQTCQKVFEFDASTLPHPARSASAFSRSSTTTRTPLRLPSASSDVLDSGGESSLVVKASENERRLHEYEELPLAQQSIDSDNDHGNHGENNQNEGESTDLLPIAVNEPTLVSVLLPSNASQAGEDGLSAVDRVFVVLLHPGERFITYSCGLSRPLLV